MMECLSDWLAKNDEIRMLLGAFLIGTPFIILIRFLIKQDEKNQKDMVYEVTYQAVGFMGNKYTIGTFPISIPYGVYIHGVENSISWTLRQHNSFIERHYRVKPDGTFIVTHSFKLIES